MNAALAFNPIPSDRRWFVARTASRHEKKVADLLGSRDIDYCLPLYDAVHRWTDRTTRVKLPLFPGYIFLHMQYECRRSALQLPGVVGLVKFGDKIAELDATDVANLQALQAGTREGVAEPFPYLEIGKRVRVVSGPFAGLEGVLKRKKGTHRLVISLRQIQRSVLVELNGAEVFPVSIR